MIYSLANHLIVKQKAELETRNKALIMEIAQLKQHSQASQIQKGYL